MEKRRTFERLQKLSFGKRAGSADSKPSKTEKLREITELIRGTRSSTSPITTTQPPVPPPLPPLVPPPIPLRFKRKQRTIDSQRSVESESDSFDAGPTEKPPPAPPPLPPPAQPNSLNTDKTLLRPIVSTSNLEALDHKKIEQKNSKSTDCLPDDELFTKVVRPEAKQIIGSYTQSTIPFRSASFSQGDTNNKNYKPRVDRATDTNRYPEISEINLNVSFDGRLENVEKAVEAIEEISEERNVEESAPKPIPGELKLKQASEMTLEPLVEEEAPLTPTTDDLQHQATTCLIPIPVYDSMVKEWSTTSPSEQWINSEIKPSPAEVIDVPSTEILPSTESSDLTTPDTQYPIELPEITESTKPRKSSKVKPDKLILEKLDEIPSQELQSPVRKRQSNNDLESTFPQSSDSEEKRRLDKSKRRKGIYIQWPALEKNQENTENLEKPWTPDVFSNDINLSDLSKIAIISDENQRKVSADTNSFSSGDPPTPDVEKNKPALFRQNSTPQRSSLAYQSSDEKDDVSEMSTPPLKQFKNLLIRGDSVSDNESDRGHSRDRASASPAPEYDWKRYSKRPLRGPYGQMLEAEMKKPSPKVHYEEILEELNKSEP